jgi:hypothetical protein
MTPYLPAHIQVRSAGKKLRKLCPEMQDLIQNMKGLRDETSSHRVSLGSERTVEKQEKSNSHVPYKEKR